ncbi:TPA: hypothetical protein ACU21L_001285 [Mannheimia haemolytica]|nr:hypothetical protein BHC25_09790 [Mannheimia haemolytica]
MIIGDDIVTNIETYSTNNKFLSEFRIYHKFLDKTEAKYILIENLEKLTFDINQIEKNNIIYIENAIKDIEQGQLTKEKRHELITFLEKITNLPANLATLIPTIIQIIKFLFGR